MVGGEGPPTGRLLAAALVMVGLLGVALNALVIAGVRQAHQCRDNKARKTKTTGFLQSSLAQGTKKVHRKKAFRYSRPQLDVTYQTLPGQE
jgi:hypothetical protein